MNARQRRRFARGVCVVENADEVRTPSGLVVLHVVRTPDGRDLEYFRPVDAERIAGECDAGVAWGSPWERALWRGSARALRLWVGQASPLQTESLEQRSPR